ncbi:MAG: terminase small subunit [Oscillospiraceae bacterium]|nr:terminase small subunit [Oscillospiraceae bacterium]
MTDNQRKFAEHYAASANATEAAKAAGYSDKTARSQGQE